jgi:hypothetical protein
MVYITKAPLLLNDIIISANKPLYEVKKNMFFANVDIGHPR